ncbi:cell division protein FtsN [Vibrio sp. UCD-FRSSP16_10]|uniref:SPOR domain-containing protein n=1 Tax=unclassified Vibrio TaxID=2614977 RepID=UPI0007FD2F8F|nr:MULTISPECIES: SPOR domain-containing protein [unclassified Vibrio]OBT10092.1 cell division protein FtsN [Vibrio sp. UCD-FRSSP16_30]OBT18882.1 cell division protein FtsN [Vibrio sp. UCD-FRSSP16_10]
MARKDYVKSGKTQSKKARKPAPSKKPWKAIILAGLLLGGFSYGLYHLSQDPKPAKPVAVDVSTKARSSTNKNAENLPPPPEEQWDYVKTLPEREIKVTPKAEVLSKVPYVMQCGAYKSHTQADGRKVDIAFQGVNSQIRQKKGSSWYRVILGPYARKRDAERDKHKLQRAKIEPCMIMKDPGY